MKVARSGLSAALSAAAISAVFLAGAADAHAKGGSPSWHGLTYHGAMLGPRGAYACDVPRRTLARSAARICRTGH
jgi:hypothetical protein